MLLPHKQSLGSPSNFGMLLWFHLTRETTMFGENDFEEDAETPIGPDTPEEASLAEDAANGSACSECGVYFAEAHGFPVLCQSCWDATTEVDHKDMGVQLATHEEIS